MLICPVCSRSVSDGSASCEHCKSSMDAGNQTGGGRFRDEQTQIAPIPVLAGTCDNALAALGSEFAPGSIVAGRYQIIQCLGQGGMGTVFKALDIELDRFIALKTIRPDVAASSNALRRLKQETLLARQISHRNVVRVFDLGVAAGLRFITMEFVEGETLRSLLDRRRKLPAEEALAVMKQVCLGLGAAHVEDVIHRDLKPQNVLISNDGRVCIMDFGLAGSLNETGLTRTGTIIGTPDYMSPEQALGKHGDSRSDIFAFGVMLYELLTGELPFSRSTLADSFLGRTRGQIRLPALTHPNIPPNLAAVVMRCLEQEPLRRYQSAQELLADLSPEGQADAPVLSPDFLGRGMMLGSRYRIEETAGEGGMGRVYRATDLSMNSTVALKIIRPEFRRDPLTLQRWKLETSMVTRVSHRHILRVFDVGEAGGVPFVAMAWAEGEDLAHLIERYGILPEERILQIAMELCEGLAAAHKHGILHRDLKPTNVLLDGAGHVCIADFGLACMLEPQQNTFLVGSREIAGTPRYMSPEQVEGKPLDARTDIYSLGLILYEMATGHIPFRDDSAFLTMAERVTQKPRNPRSCNPALSRRLATIILRCLEYDPKNRYQDACELLDDLRPWTVGAVIRGSIARLRKWIGAAGLILS